MTRYQNVVNMNKTLELQKGLVKKSSDKYDDYIENHHELSVFQPNLDYREKVMIVDDSAIARKKLT